MTNVAWERLYGNSMLHVVPNIKLVTYMLHVLMLAGILPDSVTRSSVKSGYSGFCQQQDLQLESFCTIYKPVLQRADDESHALRGCSLWKRNGES